MGEFVRIETGEAEGVATLRLDRPKVNALNSQVVAELHRAADELAGRGDIRSVVVWGGPEGVRRRSRHHRVLRGESR